MVQTDRLGEAEQVLDLLKEQELKEVVRGAADDPAAKVEPLKLTAVATECAGRLGYSGKDGRGSHGAERGVWRAAGQGESHTRGRCQVEDARREHRARETARFRLSSRTRCTRNSRRKSSTQNANALLSKEKSDVSRLQNTLADLGPRVMGIRLLLGDEHAYAIVVTAHTREKFELKATPAELRSKVLQVRDDLRSPSSDPKPHLAELYAMVVAPFDD